MILQVTEIPPRPFVCPYGPCTSPGCSDGVCELEKIELPAITRCTKCGDVIARWLPYPTCGCPASWPVWP